MWIATRIGYLLRRDKQGLAAMEFALCAPVLMGVLAILFEGGRMYWTKYTLQYATDEAGRYAMVNTAATDTQLTTQVNNNLLGMDSTTITVSIQTAVNSGITYKTMNASTTFTTFLSMYGTAPFTIAAHSQVPVIP